MLFLYLCQRRPVARGYLSVSIQVTFVTVQCARAHKNNSFEFHSYHDHIPLTLSAVAFLKKEARSEELGGKRAQMILKRGKVQK